MPRVRTAGWCRYHHRPRPWHQSRPPPTGAVVSRPLPGAPRRARPAPRRPQHRAAALARAALAGEDFIDVGRIVTIASDLVVVGKLLARLNGADRLDEHAPVIDQRLAVRVAGMVDEARIVAIDAAVDHHAAIDDEQECVVVANVLVLVAPVGLAVRQPVAEVLDDARALADAAQGEDSAAMHARAAHAHHAGSRHYPRYGLLAPRSGRPLAAAGFLATLTHTATRARIAGWDW